MYPKFKVGIEWVLALVLFIPAAVVSIVVAVIVAIVLWDMPFVRQERIGKSGKVFMVIKIRTMYPNAKEIAKEHGIPNGQQLRDDPRVFPLGRVIRRWSLDELLQIGNVVLFQMSMIGPRPMQQDEIDRLSKYKDWIEERQRVRPGMSGLSQIFGRGELLYEERLLFDCIYTLNVTPKMDWFILTNTPRVIISGTGAY